MYKPKGVRLVYIVLPVIVILAVLIFKFNNSNSLQSQTITEEIISSINEKFFDMQINLDERTIEADGEKYSLSEFFGISDKNLQRMINDGKFEELLNEELVGEISSSNGVITVENAYSTKALLVATDDEDAFDGIDGITKIDQLVKRNIYC